MKWIGPVYGLLSLVVMAAVIHGHPEQLTPTVTFICFAGGMFIGIMCSIMVALSRMRF